MKNEQVTIKDIAKLLGISTSTVSRALRGMPDVNPDTKQAVHELAEQLNYQPNLVALSLVKKRTKTIGVIIPSFTTYFYSKAICGIQEVALDAGYHIMVCQTNEDYKTEIKNIDILLSSRVDGFIASITRETENYDHYTQLIQRGIPLVLFNRICDLEVPKVVVDDYGGAYKATKHLIDIGCTKIAHIAGPDHLYLCRNRLRGFLDAMKDHKMKIYENLVVYSDFSIESGMQCGRELLQKSVKPDAVFAVCDTAAYGAMHVFKSKGLQIPADIAIVGYTNEPLSELTEPSLTTISQPIFKIGKTAAEMFIQMMNEGKEYIPETRILSTELIIRNSTRK
ncbi:MAG: LacI family DNA-binding transcriptional regulator [Cyclobacteriaceae bacterium]|nr:LacI family DNA-binding transcriptional regulator [Cyclobacteriaceae bacterium]